MIVVSVSSKRVVWAFSLENWRLWLSARSVPRWRAAGHTSPDCVSLR
jgi:hypothetical protein